MEFVDIMKKTHKDNEYCNTAFDDQRVNPKGNYDHEYEQLDVKGSLLNPPASKAITIEVDNSTRKLDKQFSVKKIIILVFVTSFVLAILQGLIIFFVLKTSLENEILSKYKVDSKDQGMDYTTGTTQTQTPSTEMPVSTESIKTGTTTEITSSGTTAFTTSDERTTLVGSTSTGFATSSNAESTSTVATTTVVTTTEPTSSSTPVESTTTTVITTTDPTSSSTSIESTTSETSTAWPSSSTSSLASTSTGFETTTSTTPDTTTTVISEFTSTETTETSSFASPASNYGVSLRGGSYLQGRVEIYYSGVWGTICDDGWDDYDATVVCKQLGFRSGTGVGSAYFGQGSGIIWMDDVNCHGNEIRLDLCPFRGWGNHNCGHAKDAGVICTT